MNGLVWVFSGVLALVLLIDGVVKAWRFDVAKNRQPWVNDMPRALVAFIGIAEILGAVGLILPVATGIYPWLTLAAAAALALLMFMAALFHALRRDNQEIALPVLLLLLLALVAYIRWTALPPA